tara:strand:+ start:307 stop:519 length:213 start_codon:yes stop_codon:yes gene_type:complete
MPKKQKPLELDLKEGAFLRMSKEKGYGKDVQKLATDIMKFREKGKLPNGKRITPLMVKRANFVKVSKKWK